MPVLLHALSVRARRVRETEQAKVGKQDLQSTGEALAGGNDERLARRQQLLPHDPVDVRGKGWIA